MRKIAKDAESQLALTMDAHGLKPPKALRHRKHVKQALAEAKEEAKHEGKRLSPAARRRRERAALRREISRAYRSLLSERCGWSRWLMSPCRRIPRAG